MASLKDIRRRISSVKSTQQITKAMKMVAAAKLRRAQETINGARPFAERIEDLTSRIVSDLIAGVDSSKTNEALRALHPLLASQLTSSKKIALIVVSSDKGLCGGYNTNILRKAHKAYEDLLSEEGSKVELYFVGKKGYEFFKKHGVAGHRFESFWTGSFSAQKTDEVAKFFVDRFVSGEFDRVEVCFTEFKTALTQIQRQKVLIPLQTKASALSVETTNTENNLEIIYKPEKKELLEKLVPKQVETQFFRVFADAMASEFGAKMTAMDSATTNAKDMISKLTLDANRLRQAAITTELMEIVSGAESLKG